MDKFTQALVWLIGVLNNAWELAFNTIPGLAITFLTLLIIISIVIDRLINPMIGKATDAAIDRAMFSGKRERLKYEKRQAASARNLIRQTRNQNGRWNK